jgi:outer membrane lipoprotein SlyB
MKTSQFSLVLTIWMCALSCVAQTQTSATPKAQYAVDSKVALDRYEGDKKLCNDESSSTARLQCRRDAKTEYDKAMVSAKTKMTAATPATTSPPKTGSTMACPDCGKVVAVSVTEKEGEGSAVGMVAGGVAGALLGHQVGGGIGKDLATIAGAAGGAYAGKVIEGKVKTHKVWHVSVQYVNGNKHSFEFDKDPGFAVGDAVKNSGGSIVQN